MILRSDSDYENALRVVTDLPAADRARIVDDVSRGLEGLPPGINKTPGVCGGDACIRNTRIMVWLLEGYRRLGMNEAEILHSYPSLVAADLVNAWAYVNRNTDEIEEAIRQNEEE